MLKSILKADIRFVGHNAQMVDMYVSFARQAAQAMTIKPSKTIYPIKNTPDLMFQPSEAHLKNTMEEGSADLREISYEYDRWTVNKSPFVYGRHQDQFEIRTYLRDLQLFDADSETIKRWLHYISMNLPFGVGVEYSIHEYEDYQPKKELKNELNQ